MQQPANDEIAARDVLKDIHRLALDGYRIEATFDDETAEITVSAALYDGQRQLAREVIATSPAVENAAEIFRDVSLLDAMAAYLNAGGAPDDIVRLATKLSHMPKLEWNGYELMRVEEDVTRTLFYRGPTGRMIKVIPGVMAFELSDKQVSKLMNQ